LLLGIYTEQRPEVELKYSGERPGVLQGQHNRQLIVVRPHILVFFYSANGSKLRHFESEFIAARRRFDNCSAVETAVRLAPEEDEGIAGRGGGGINNPADDN
jgi:hypothetical protein